MLGWTADVTMPNGQPVTPAAVTQDIVELVRAESGVTDLGPDSGLQDAGLDSAHLLSLVFRIEARYDIDLDAQDGDDLTTIGDLAALVVRRIEERA